jgi:hypothetical protein
MPLILPLIVAAVLFEFAWPLAAIVLLCWPAG